MALACELTAWTQMLALTGKARRWEPKRLRLRVFAVAGRLVSGGRRLRLRLAERWPWAAQITAAITRLQARVDFQRVAAPGCPAVAPVGGVPRALVVSPSWPSGCSG